MVPSPNDPADNRPKNEFLAYCQSMDNSDNPREFVMNTDFAKPNGWRQLVFISLALAYTKRRELLHEFLEECIKQNTSNDATVLVIFLALYYLQLYSENNDDKASKEEANSLIQKAIANGTKLPLYWLASCYNQLLNKNYAQAADNLYTAKTTLSAARATNYSGAMIDFLRLEPLIDFASGVIHFRRENYEAAARDFQLVVEHAANSIPLSRLALGMAFTNYNQIFQATCMFKGVLEYEQSKKEKNEKEEKEEKFANIIAHSYLAILRYKQTQDYYDDQLINHISKAREIYEKNPDLQKTAPFAASLLLRFHVVLYRELHPTDKSDKSNESESKRIKVMKKMKKKLKNMIIKKGENGKKSVESMDENVLSEAYFQFGRICHLSIKESDKGDPAGKKHGKGEKEQAEKAYSKAIEYNPDHALAHLGLARFCLASHRYNEAIDHLNGRRIFAESAEARMILGFSYANLYRKDGQKENHDNAITHLSNCVRIIQNSEEAKIPAGITESEKLKIHETLGWLYLKGLDFKRASENLKIPAEAGSEQSKHLYAISLFQMKEYENALEVFNTLQEKTPVVKFNIGRCYESLLDLDEAKRIYNELIQDYPTFAEPYLRMAAISISLRDHASAAEYYHRCNQYSSPPSVLADLALAKLFYEDNKLDHAVQCLKRVLSNHSSPDGILTAIVLVGNIYLSYALTRKDPNDRLQRVPKALNQYRTALEKNDKCIAAANGLIICQLLLGYVESATDKLALMREERPEYPSSYLNYAFSLMSSKNKTPEQMQQHFSQAMQLFEEANRQHFDNTNVPIWVNYYEAAKFGYRFEEGLNAAEQLIALNPADNNHWYYFVASLMKCLNYRVKMVMATKQLPNPMVVQKWLKQAERCRSLLEKYCGLFHVDHDDKMNEIEKHLIPSLESLKKRIEEDEERRRLQNQDEVLKIVDEDSDVE